MKKLMIFAGCLGAMIGTACMPLASSDQGGLEPAQEPLATIWPGARGRRSREVVAFAGWAAG